MVTPPTTDTRTTKNHTTPEVKAGKSEEDEKKTQSDTLIQKTTLMS